MLEKQSFTADEEKLLSFLAKQMELKHHSGKKTTSATDKRKHAKMKAHIHHKQATSAHTKTHTKAHTQVHSPMRVPANEGQMPSDRRAKLAPILANPPDFNTPDPNDASAPQWLKPNPVYQQLIPRVYQQYAQLCSQHVPWSLLDTCTPLMPKFKAIADALRLGDRADEICRTVVSSCPPGSYIEDVPHVFS